jgi:hypothetical protein
MTSPAGRGGTAALGAACELLFSQGRNRDMIIHHAHRLRADHDRYRIAPLRRPLLDTPTQGAQR